MSERCSSHYTTAGKILRCRKRLDHDGSCHWWASSPSKQVRLLSVRWRAGGLI